MINTIITKLINFRRNMEYRTAVRTTIKELSKLTNHELQDIGICRGEIYTIAHNSYNKPQQVKLSEISASINLSEGILIE